MTCGRKLGGHWEHGARPGITVAPGVPDGGGLGDVGKMFVEDENKLWHLAGV